MAVHLSASYSDYIVVAVLVLVLVLVVSYTCGLECDCAVVHLSPSYSSGCRSSYGTTGAGTTTSTITRTGSQLYLGLECDGGSLSRPLAVFS